MTESSPESVLLVAAYHGNDLVARHLLPFGQTFHGGAIATGNAGRHFAASVFHTSNITTRPLSLIGTVHLTSYHPFPSGRAFRIGVSFPRQGVLVLELESWTHRSSFCEFHVDSESSLQNPEGLIGTFGFFRRYYPLCASPEKSTPAALRQVRHLNRFLLSAARAIRNGKWRSLRRDIVNAQTALFVCDPSAADPLVNQATLTDDNLLAFLDNPAAREHAIENLLYGSTSLFFMQGDTMEDTSLRRVYKTISHNLNQGYVASTAPAYREPEADTIHYDAAECMEALLANLDLHHTVHPEPGVRGASIIVTVWVFLRSQAQDLKAMLDQNLRLPGSVPAFSHIHMRTGAGLILKGRLQLDGDDLQAAHSECTLQWNGAIAAANLSIRIPLECNEGLFTGRIHLSRLRGAGSGNEEYIGHRELAIAVRKRQIFVSYSRADGPLVEPIVEILRTFPEIRVFFDKKDIDPGEDWRARVANEIHASDAFCLMWSEMAMRSENVAIEREEAQSAAHSRRCKICEFYHVIPLPNAKMAGIIPECPHINVTPLKQWDAAAIRKCLAASASHSKWRGAFSRLPTWLNSYVNRNGIH